jgi:hypothetical protein
MMEMTVHPNDTVKYRGEICVVETTWITEDDTHTPYCALRPLDPEAPQGMYLTDMESVDYYSGGF